MMKHTIALLALLLTTILPLPAQPRRLTDWAKLNTYARDNNTVKTWPRARRRAVFIGNSITQRWQEAHPAFFSDNGFVCRGISGQATTPMLVRFRHDVVSIRPKVVVIHAGINDIAENDGPYRETVTFSNIQSMVEIACANHIKVVLTSVLPATVFRKAPQVTDRAERIAGLNRLIQGYAERNKIPYVDYYHYLGCESGSDIIFRPELTTDGVHPNADGYTRMESILMKVLRKML